MLHRFLVDEEIRIDDPTADLDGIRVPAGIPKPLSEAEVESLATQPDRWFQVGPSGWLERKTGKQWKHTGGLKKLDPVIDGKDEGWGQDDPDGWGQVDELLLEPYLGQVVVSFWMDLNLEIILDHTLLAQAGSGTSGTSGLISLIQVAPGQRISVAFTNTANEFTVDVGPYDD